MKNVTVTLDEDTARWARVEAAKRDMSLSRFIRELLEAQMTHDHDYEEAMQRFFATEPRPLKRPGERYPSRDEMHDRGRLR
jgi:hypothetical protein